jgi:hypothetical protein
MPRQRRAQSRAFIIFSITPRTFAHRFDRDLFQFGLDESFQRRGTVDATGDSRQALFDRKAVDKNSQQISANLQ